VQEDVMAKRATESSVPTRSTRDNLSFSPFRSPLQALETVGVSLAADSDHSAAERRRWEVKAQIERNMTTLVVRGRI
jgi:hypothetical protein